MTTPKASDSITLQHANVGTRWHQLSGILGVLLVGPLVAGQVIPLVGRGDLSIWLCFLIMGLGMALPAVLVMVFQPMRQSVSVDAEGLRFGRRGRVLFSEINQLRQQDFLTLHRTKGATLIIQQGKHDLDSFNRFCKTAGDHWFAWRCINGCPPGANWRATLYDMAKIVGIITAGLVLLIGIFALTFNLVFPIAVYLILAALFIIGLVCAIFYGA